MILQNFLKLKKTSRFQKDEKRMFKYPILLIKDGVIDKYYIQDAETRISDDGKVHTLKVVLIDSSKQKIYIGTRECRVAPGCVVDWAMVSCSLDLKSLFE